MDVGKLKALLIKHEDLRLMMYKCSAGKNTIGVGHNLDANPISKKAADVILEDDVQAIVFGPLDANIPWWRSLDDVRQLVLADMCFNLGWNKPDGTPALSAFKNTLRAVQEGRYEDAAKGMESSLWYKQVGNRAVRLVAMMRTGNEQP